MKAGLCRFGHGTSETAWARERRRVFPRCSGEQPWVRLLWALITSLPAQNSSFKNRKDGSDYVILVSSTKCPESVFSWPSGAAWRLVLVVLLGPLRFSLQFPDFAFSLLLILTKHPRSNTNCPPPRVKSEGLDSRPSPVRPCLRDPGQVS